MAKLDRNRDFGEVSGDLEDGTRYFQDDKRFDGAGNEIAAERTKKADKVKVSTKVESELAPVATTVETLDLLSATGADEQLESQMGIPPEGDAPAADQVVA